MKRLSQGWRPALVAVLVLALLSGALPAAAAPIVPVTGGWPLAGSGRLLRGFSPPSTPWGAGHRGVDLAASVGDPVLAAAEGRVTFAGMLAGRGVVVVDHGSVRTTYEPVSASVRVGQRVSLGQVIGHLTRGSHCGAVSCLHWGLLHGKTYLDPLTLAGDTPLRATGHVRLLPASARAVAVRRAAARAVARAAEQAARAAAAAAAGPAAATLVETGGAGGAHGFLRPVAGAITSGFGRRLHPVLKVWKLHDGTDFGAPCGTPIRAPAAGVVTRAYRHRAYGNRLFLDHGVVDGQRVVTSYNHAARFVVGVGDHVTRGQVIGYVGATGYATGCHLHLMIWLDGHLRNPMSWW